MPKKQKDHPPKAPARMPRPEASDVGDPEPELSGDSRSPLGLYLKLNKLSLNAFARAANVAFKTVSEWAKGESLPSLPGAYEIERLTKGVVPMESWLAMPQAKAVLHKYRANQPQELRDIKPPPAGGFASPQLNAPGEHKQTGQSRPRSNKKKAAP